VHDAEGRAVGSARVCYVDDETVQRCAITDDAGRFEMPSMELDTLEVAADGFLVRDASAEEFDRPIVLQPAPTLYVRLVDARTGEPIESADVFVAFPSGREMGPFPANRAGVRVKRVIEPGKVRLRVEAAGYAPGRPREVELIGGKETEVELRLEPEPEPESGEPDS